MNVRRFQIVHALCVTNLGINKAVNSLSQVTFEPEPRRQYLKLLGYDTEELAKKVCYPLKFLRHQAQ